jgi:hypothetical protein
MLRFIRLPSPALVVALVALFVALGSSAYAVTKVNGKNLMNRSVTAVKIKKRSLTRNELNLRKLGVLPRAALANEATLAENAGQLDGHAADFFQARCEPGSTRGFAIVNGNAEFPSAYTALQTHIPSSFNCVQGAVEARRVGEGNYRVRFTNNPSNVATANAYGSGGNFNAYIALNKESTENSFEVVIRNHDGDAIDHHFVIMLG